MNNEATTARLESLVEEETVGIDPAADQAKIYEYVGKRLRDLRTERRLTQAEVAAVIGVSPQQYQKYEDAQTKCSLAYLLALSDHFSVPIDSILPGTKHAASQINPESDMVNEADLLARLVSSFVRLDAFHEKLRLVQLVEAIVAAQREK